MRLLDARRSRSREGGASFSLSHRVFRAVWTVAWLVFASWTPPPMHRWRIFLLRIFGGKVHWTAHVYSSASIWYPPHLTMEENSCLGSDSRCYCMAPILIKKDAVVSQGAHLCAGSHDIQDSHFQLIVKPISLGVGSWVAAEAFVGPGVTVGDRAVVGARSVLFKDAISDSVYIGNPAAFLKKRRLR